MSHDRRAFLSFAAGGCVAALVAGTARAEAGGTCVDLASLPLSQKSRRRSLGYVDPSVDPKKRCGLCSFFTSRDGGCGTCQMLGGGAVSGNAVCNSFAPKG